MDAPIPRGVPLFRDGIRHLPLLAGAALGAYSGALLYGAHRGPEAAAAALAGVIGGLALDSDAFLLLPVLGYLAGLASLSLSVGATGLAAMAYGPWIILGGARFATWPAFAVLAVADVLSLWLGLHRLPAAGPPALTALLAPAGALVLLHLGAVGVARESRARSHLALTDPLTGLANRRLLDWRMAEESSQAQRTGGTFALVYLDVLDFRVMNLRAGRRVGDRVLVQVAQILRDTVRTHDVTARVDGDDFVILAPGLGETDAAVVIERVRAAVARATTLPYPIRFAAGWATAPRDGTDAILLIETAASRAFEEKIQSRSAGPSLPMGLTTALWSLPEAAQQLVRLLHTEGIEREEHLSRVGQWCLELGQIVGLGADRQAALAQAALVHDVGKLVIPRSLLRKPGPLATDEQSILVQHVTSGVALLRALAVDEAVVAIVAAHHERWDGTGYPSSLAGEQIPIEARILAIADGCDAMTERRPYRKPWTIDEAIADVQLEGGRQFDPGLVNLIIPVLSGPE
jgi:diguanylate cyclase (GGDEF)-like protein/putative nucleotidyltransferase with HDIG domain